MIEARSAARLILLDEDGRVLLFLYVDRSGRGFWATPGGGIEPGESAENAARREAAEELGTKDIEIVPLWSGHRDFAFNDREFSQDETFFLLKRHSTLFGPEVERFHRLEGIKEVRWWSLSEIESSTEAIFPPDLVGRLRENLPQLPGN